MKRKRGPRADHHASKRAKVDPQSQDQPTWPLLRCYYPNVSTLRQYLASKLAKTSKKRSRVLSRYGRDTLDGVDGSADAALSRLLDKTVVGSFAAAQSVDLDAIEKDISVFTQQLSDSTTSISPTQGALKQSEVDIPISCVQCSRSAALSLQGRWQY